jgi:hypothetical protein
VGLLDRARRNRLPDDAAALLGVERGERVLAWSTLAGGGYAAATAQGLSVLAPSGRIVRRPWVEVDHAAWDQDSRTLAVWWVGSRQATPLEVTAGSFLPEVVHERVRASVVASREVPVGDGRAVWVALRKAADGTLSTQAVPPPGVRLDDAALAARVAAVTLALREEAGLS